MLNNIMTEPLDTNLQQSREIPAEKTRPNERTGLNIDEHVKIFDPETKQVWLEKRA